MDDTEMTRLCAQAMGYKGESLSTHWGGLPMFASEIGPYNPLHDDAQAMALVKRLHLHIDQRPGLQITVQDSRFEYLIEQRADFDLNRAIVACVAKMQAKSPVLNRTTT